MSADGSKEHIATICRVEEQVYPLHVGFLLRLFFYLEDGGDMFLRIFG
jgi:hypothetical protein